MHMVVKEEEDAEMVSKKVKLKVTYPLINNLVLFSFSSRRLRL